MTVSVNLNYLMENLPWDIESCRHYGQLAQKLFVLLTIWSDVIQVVKLLLYSSWLQFQRDSILCCELIQWLIHRTREAKHHFLLKSCILQAVLVDGSQLFWCWSDVERIISFSRNCKNMGPNIPRRRPHDCTIFRIFVWDTDIPLWLSSPFFI